MKSEIRLLQIYHIMSLCQLVGDCKILYRTYSKKRLSECVKTRERDEVSAETYGVLFLEYVRYKILLGRTLCYNWTNSYDYAANCQIFCEV